VPRPLRDHSLAIGRRDEVRPVDEYRIAVAGLAGAVAGAAPRVEHLLGLVDPGVRALRAGDAGGVVVSAPEDEGLAVLQPGRQVAAERLALAQVDHGRRPGIAGQVLRRAVAAIGA